jgi:hypothetical protein
MYILRYENCNYDVELEKQFLSLESLQKFVKDNIAHDLTMLPISLRDENTYYDVKEYVNKVAGQGDYTESMPITTLVFDDKTRSMVDKEAL